MGFRKVDGPGGISMYYHLNSIRPNMEQATLSARDLTSGSFSFGFYFHTEQSPL